jgi:hypothetical protein
MAGQGWTEDDIQTLLVNPIYAVSISPSLAVEHEPLVERSQWISANARLIKEIGAEAWLERLLDVLESGGITDEPSPQAPLSPSLPKSRQQRRLEQRRRTKLGERR